MSMGQAITIREAIEQGRRQTLLPRVLLIIGALLFIGPLIILCLIIANYSERSQQMLLLFAGIVLLAFMIFVYLPFSFWRKRLLAWQQWAYANCSDVTELKKNARLSALNFDDSLLGRWLSTGVPEGFAYPGHFTDDPGVPAETVIGISWGHLIFNLVMQIIFIGLGVVIFVYAPKNSSRAIYILAGILIAGMLYAMFTYIRDMLIRRPTLIISNEGIQTVDSGFHPWPDIRNERIVIKRRARGASVEVLCFDFPGGSESLALTPYSISHSKIERLLYVYRKRNG